MAFDRNDYGMNSGIPFIKIADRVEVSVDLKGDRISGPALVFKQQLTESPSCGSSCRYEGHFIRGIDL
jgi:hypothetical protein